MMSILDEGTESGRRMQVTEETVWIKSQSRGSPTSSLLFPDCPLSPLIGELRFWKSSFLATDEEAKQTNNFKNISTKGSSKEAALCSLSKHSMLWRQQLSQERRRKLITGVTHRICWCPSRKSKLSPQSYEFQLSSVDFFCRGMINSHQSCIRTSII